MKDCLEKLGFETPGTLVHDGKGAVVGWMSPDKSIAALRNCGSMHYYRRNKDGAMAPCVGMSCCSDDGEFRVANSGWGVRWNRTKSDSEPNPYIHIGNGFMQLSGLYGGLRVPADKLLGSGCMPEATAQALGLFIPAKEYIEIAVIGNQLQLTVDGSFCLHDRKLKVIERTGDYVEYKMGEATEIATQTFKIVGKGQTMRLFLSLEYIQALQCILRENIQRYSSAFITHVNCPIKRDLDYPWSIYVAGSAVIDLTSSTIHHMSNSLLYCDNSSAMELMRLVCAATTKGRK